ncbi:hypothetical protein LTS18_005523 [Coniosporium uncinatum]|uniref:Uncharacterized protein n=1 Tax=Coniosporium uncinatum TaxID=93489 RepID=A0ACC3D4K8_9PEZI|nr:hypothetical protein LTS18_005523 [Coniosporium uncinatum]
MSWGEGRLDVWAVHEDSELQHKFWNGSMYQGWESLGGSFTTAPQVVHWSEGKIDIVGKNGSCYVSKAFDGENWYPSYDGWFDKGGKFASEPAIWANKGTNFIYVLGVGEDGQLKLQIWDGYNWQPAGDQYWDLGDTQNPYGKSVDFFGKDV